MASILQRCFFGSLPARGLRLAMAGLAEYAAIFEPHRRQRAAPNAAGVYRSGGSIPHACWAWLGEKLGDSR